MESSVQALRHPKRDGWYSWLVASGAFISLFFGVGFSFGSIGVLTVAFRKEYIQATEDDLAWIGSLRAGFLYVGGIFASALLDKVGCRIMTIVGGTLAALGMGLGCLATELWHVYLSVGVLCGVGISCVFTSASIVTNGYFVKWKHVAFAIAYLGDNVGAGAFGVVTQSILDALGLHDTLLTLAGMMAMHFMCAAIFAPPLREMGTADIPLEGHNVKKKVAEKRKPSLEAVEMCNVAISRASAIDASAIDANAVDARAAYSRTELQSPPSSTATDACNNVIAKFEALESGVAETELDSNSDAEQLAAPAGTLAKLSHLLRQWKVWILLLTMFSWEWADAAYLSLLPLHADRVNLTESEGALGVTLLGVGGTLGNIVLIPLATRAYNHLALYAWGCLLSGIVGMLYPVWSSVYAYCTLSVIFGFWQGMVIALTMSVASTFTDDEHLTLLFGLTTVACGIGGLAGPEITGYILEHFGDAAALILCGALSASMFFVLLPLLVDVKGFCRKTIEACQQVLNEKLGMVYKSPQPA